MKSFKNRFTEAPREGAGESPRTGAKRYFFLLSTHFGKLIGANLLFLLFSVPIVTMPAAKCAMNRVLIKLVRDGNCFLWDEFWKEFRSQLLRSLPVGILFAALLGLSYYSLSLVISNTGEIPTMAFLALGLAALLAETLLSAYAFVLFPMLDLRGGDILKDSVALMLRGGGRALAAAGIKLFALALQALLFPVGLLLLLTLPALCELALCLLINPLVQKYIIEPFEAGKDKKAID